MLERASFTFSLSFSLDVVSNPTVSDYKKIKNKRPCTTITEHVKYYSL